MRNINTFECQDCKKIFNYASKLAEHNNRKIPCINKTIDFNCNLCNFKCNYLSNYNQHCKTKKHINNELNKPKENNKIAYMYSNSFSETDISCLKESDLLYELESQYIIDNYINEIVKDRADQDRSSIYNSICELYIKLYYKIRSNDFNINNNFNVYKYIEFGKAEYLILENDHINKTCIQKNIEYNEFVDVLLDIMNQISIKFNNILFNEIMDYMINKIDYCQRYIEKQLIIHSGLYNINKKETKDKNELIESRRQQIFKNNSWIH